MRVQKQFMREFKECFCLVFCYSTRYKGCKGCKLTELDPSNAGTIKLRDMLKFRQEQKPKRKKVKFCG